MSWGMWFFGPECRAKCVDISQGTTVIFYGQLSGDCYEGRFSKKVFWIIDSSVLVKLHALVVDFFFWVWKSGCYLKHFTSSFTVRSCNNRSMDILESTCLEKNMSGICQVISNSANRGNNFRSRSQMCEFSEFFHRNSFSSHWIFLTVSFLTFSNNFGIVSWIVSCHGHFKSLSFCGTFNNFSAYSKGCTNITIL